MKTYTCPDCKASFPTDECNVRPEVTTQSNAVQCPNCGADFAEPVPTIVYTFRGRIERGNGKPGYDWRNGYSETTADGHEIAPWMTFRECQQDAKSKGARAMFESLNPFLPSPTDSPERAAEATPDLD